MNINCHKINIDNFLNNKNKKNLPPNEYECEYIYGGVTENTMNTRRTEHIRDRKPVECDSNWIISQKAITTITINDDTPEKLEQYKQTISGVEQYLINALDKKYERKCVNDRNNDMTIAQRGGAGIRLNKNDKYEVYIFYKIKKADNDKIKENVIFFNMVKILLL